MKKLLFISFLVALLACKKNEKNAASVTLNFQTEIDGNSSALSEIFMDSEGRGIKIELLKFYLSDIYFVDSKKDKVYDVEDIALLEIAANGSGNIELKVPAGDYQSMHIGIGVPQSLNESDPSDYTQADHPLSTTQNTYWGMNAMYRFVMVDGRYDIENDAVFDGTFSYHTGYNSSYRNLSFDQDFSFDKKGEHTINLGIDITAILEGSGGNQDVVNASNFHGNQADIAIANLVSDNFVNALSLK